MVDPRGPSAVGGAPLSTPRYAVPSRTLPPAGFIPPCLLEGALNEGGQALIGNAELKRTHIIVDGGCNSACTLVLGNADVCSTDRGFFYFHAALKDDAPSPEGTAYRMSVYPQEVKDWIMARGGLTNEWIGAQQVRSKMMKVVNDVLHALEAQGRSMPSWVRQASS